MKTIRKKLGNPSYITVRTADKNMEAYLDGDSYAFDDVKVHFADEGEHLGIYLQADETPVRWLKIRWNLSWPKKVRFLGDAWERGYGDFEWRGITADRFMPWYFCAAGQDEIACYGVKVRPSALAFWQTDSQGLTLFLDVRCGGNGVKLKGRTLKAVEVVAAQMEEGNTFQAMSEFCGILCTDPVLPSYPVYGSNNWYYAYGDSSEQEILADCDYVLSLTEGVKNPPYMVVDDCWQEHHRLNEYNGGPWTKGNEKFPDMKGLAEKMTAKGVRPGIWVRFLLNESEEIPAEWRISHNGCLDPTHPDALAYIREDVERICQWGYTLIKHDFSTFDLFGRWGYEMNPLMTENGWHFYDESMTSAEVVKKLYETIYEVCAKYNTLILGCNTVGHLGAGLMHINRTGDDTSGKNWERSRRLGINTLAFRLPQHRKFYEVDADCVGIYGPIAWRYNRQLADLFAYSGTSLFVSAKPGVLTEEEKEELRQLMLIASEQKHHLIPTDWEDTDCPEYWVDQEHGEERHYQWYEDSGVRFSEYAKRSQPYLTIVR